MAPPPTNPKIDELRFRLKADPRSRLFYPLAEELRKVGQFPEAEQVLRGGLANHPTYLSAWVSLGRVLRDRKEERAAVEPLSKALQLDPENVVAARLLADAYFALDEKVEAIKKYKLVHALMPVDEDVAGRIAQLERELNPVPAPPPESQAAAPPPAEVSPFESADVHAPLADDTARDLQPPARSAARSSEAAEASPFADEPSSPFAAEPPHRQPELVWSAEPSAQSPAAWTPEADVPAEPAAEAFPTLGAWSSDRDGGIDEGPAVVTEEERMAVETADAEPMHAEHEQSPFEEPDDDYTSAAFAVEAPEGMHIARAPLLAEVPLVWPEAEALPLVDQEPLGAETAGHDVPNAAGTEGEAIDEADVFAPAGDPSAVDAPFDLETAAAQDEPEDLTATLTMADLYARQGLTADARRVYEAILHREPANQGVRVRLEALAGSQTPGSQMSGSERAADPRARKVAALQSWLVKVSRGEVGSV